MSEDPSLGAAWPKFVAHKIVRAAPICEILHRRRLRLVESVTSADRPADVAARRLTRSFPCRRRCWLLLPPKPRIIS
jgi:hypothetical protein